MKLLRPEGEKLTHKQLTKRAEAYRHLALSLLRWKDADEFTDKLEQRFENLAVQYQKRADRFLIASGKPPT